MTAKDKPAYRLGVVGDANGFHRARLEVVLDEASQLGAEGIKVKDWTDEECDAIAERSKRLGLRPPNRWVGTGWTPEQIAMLGTASDEVVARMIGRSDNAVRLKRERLGILRHEGRK